MLREGTYLARVSAFEGMTLSNNGVPQVAVQFTTNEGRIIAWWSLSDKAVRYTFEKLRTCGWKGNDVSAITLEDLTNDVEIVVKHEEFNGEQRAKVTFVNPVGGGIKAGKPMSDVERKAYAQKLKGLAMAIAPVVSSAPAAEQVKREPGDDSVRSDGFTDDAPF